MNINKSSKISGIIDYHVHSRFSADGQASIAELCAQAVRIGCQEIIFTDHLSFFPGDPNYYLNNHQEISWEIKHYRDIYQDQLIIGYGVEIDFQPETLDIVSDYLSGQVYDYVLTGVHYVGKVFVLYPEYFAGKTLKEAYKQYFHMIKEAAGCQLFDAIAHLDYVKRGARKYYPDSWKKELKAFTSEIKEILGLMIQGNIALELNTSGPRRNLPEFFPGPEILSWYHELGGTLLTVGSDTHVRTELGRGVGEAFQLLKELGLTEVTLFQQRRPCRRVLL